MEQQRPRHYPQEEEENEEAVALRRRQSRHRNDSPGQVPPPALALPHVIVSTNYENGATGVHEEEAAKGKLEEEDEEVGNTFTWPVEEEDKEGIPTGEVSLQAEHVTGVESSIASEQWNVIANRSAHIETRLENVEEIGNESLSTAIEAAALSEDTKITTTFEDVENKNGSVGEVGLIEVELEPSEYEVVERVIEKQHTHDLFCPNCNKCITKTVILRRKKVKIPRHKPKRRQIPPRAPEPPADTGTAPLISPHHEERAERAEVFSCVACLKFFIPKAFLRGTDDENERIQRQEQANISTTTTTKTNWFISILPSRYKKTDEVGSAVDNSKLVQTPSNGIVTSPTQEDKGDKDANIVEKIEDKENGAVNNSLIVETSDQTIISPKLDDKSGDFKLKPPEGGQLKSIMISGDEAVAKPIVPASPKPIESAIIEENQSLQKQEEVNISKEEKTSWFISIFPFIKSNKTEDFKVVKPRDQGGLESLSRPLLGTGYKTVTESTIAVTPNQSGDEVDIESPPVRTSTATPVLLPERQDDGARPVREWDVMKSVVYGGLVESLTSLGVVSSAAAAGATTLNIFAIGLANLISGLFVLGHNLRELKKEKSEDQTANQFNDRYQKVLGRGNFSVHATVAVISYLVFGLLPPVIYGFSFRISDNSDYKLAAVLGASLLCIALLAIANCYANKKPPKSYFTTLLYYLSTGAVAACLSYLVGVFIKKLMERLGWFDSSSSSIDSVSFMGTISKQPAWASY